jgi:hypothetical protein
VAAGWDNFEPQRGVYRADYRRQLVRRVASLRAKGFKVIIDPGLQYPPSWVFDLPGQTRFVDQYGDTWTGPESQDVPDAVWNPSVRAAEGHYLNHLSKALRHQKISHVRVGGLLSGELRLPVSTYDGHADLLWDYSPAAQAAAPVPGWVPGTGTTDQIAASLSYYMQSLDNYEAWLLQRLGAGFPTATMLLMMPSWGLRPGMLDEVVATGMTGQTSAEVGGLVSQGVDWASQVAVLKASGVSAMVYSTWLDAPSFGRSPAQEAPIAYLATLAAKYGLPSGGENTGGGGAAALAACLAAVKAHHLAAMVWMNGPDLAAGRDGLTTSSFTSATRTAF